MAGGWNLKNCSNGHAASIKMTAVPKYGLQYPNMIKTLNPYPATEGSDLGLWKRVFLPEHTLLAHLSSAQDELL